MRLSFREKVLLLAFLWVLVVLMADSVLGSLRSEFRVWRSHQPVLAFQKQRLKEKPAIDDALAATRARYDASRTRNSAELAGHIDLLMTKSGFRPRTFTTREQEGDVFNLYDMRVSVDRVELSNILDFEAMIRQEAPYINLAAIRISADSARPDRVDVVMEISSFELKEAAGE